MFYPLLTEKGKMRCLMYMPSVSVAAQEAKRMIECSDRLGLNPSARSRIAVPDAGSSMAQAVAKRLLG